MSGEDELRSLWRAQPTNDAPELSADALRARAAELARKSSRRNWREIIAGVLGIAFVGAGVALFASSIPLAAVGCVMLIVGQTFVLVTLVRRGFARRAPDVTASTADHIAHYRAELVRERDLLGTAWLWYVAPLLPGLVLTPVALILAVGAHAPAAWTWMNLVIFVVVTLAIGAGIASINRRASKKLAREIDALDAGGDR
jgi:hypothetical protein